jgi:hypothetical protein
MSESSKVDEKLFFMNFLASLIIIIVVVVDMSLLNEKN